MKLRATIVATFGALTIAGVALHPRATVTAAALSLSLAFAGPRRAAIVVYAVLLLGGLLGLRLDQLPHAT